jgi:hypothetical protein
MGFNHLMVIKYAQKRQHYFMLSKMNHVFIALIMTIIFGAVVVVRYCDLENYDVQCQQREKCMDLIINSHVAMCIDECMNEAWDNCMQSIWNVSMNATRYGADLKRNK